ncbi:carbon storage regulator [Candidatus Scalindua japonica]|uniref:Carbon storage regulator n=1 Tax=Candidatus Scalindua japonica TaxID=1284222 RepID=A0A286TTW0_9BACT|nr:carbon storage regulator [Candidatus Scalindua japonica]GAX59314.1 carbon storage regulator [Candidatus Scalindua japonica]
MLVLNRRFGESLIIRGDIKITAERISKKQVKICMKAPKGVIMKREKACKKIQVGNLLHSDSVLHNDSSIQNLLHHYRDNFLLKTAVGKILTVLFYWTSASAVEALNDNPGLIKEARFLID